jgi:hypothetical protein
LELKIAQSPIGAHSGRTRAGLEARERCLSEGIYTSTTGDLKQLERLLVG